VGNTPIVTVREDSRRKRGQIKTVVGKEGIRGGQEGEATIRRFTPPQRTEGIALSLVENRKGGSQFQLKGGKQKVRFTACTVQDLGKRVEWPIHYKEESRGPERSEKNRVA